MSCPANTYDELPYDDLCFSATHPDRLATMGTLHGMSPPPIQTCRVLELGCGIGINLAGMAATLPEARFTGVDLSARQIEMGRRAMEAMGLDNVELLCQDIASFDPPGPFDYIVCHGVYSWVPPAAQAAILRICQRRLAPNGLAQVSYNTYPGWRYHGAVRDILLFGSRTPASPARRVQEALEFLAFVAQHSLDPDKPHARHLRQVAQDLAAEVPTYVFHEYLEEHNEPVHFEEFVRRAAEAGLQYVSEPWLSDVPARLGDQARSAVERIEDAVQREQVLDFLQNRRFRQSLLCRRGVSLDRRPRPATLRKLLLASTLSPISGRVDLQAEAAQQFSSAAGVTVTTNMPSLKAALAALEEARPAAVPYWDLWKTVRARTPRDGPDPPEKADADIAELAEPLLTCAYASVADLHVYSPPMSLRPAQRPRAGCVARWQAQRTNRVVNFWHHSLQLDDVSAAVLLMLDGTNDRAQLAHRLEDLMRQGRLQLAPPEAAQEITRQGLEHSLDALLHRFALQALLEPQ